MKQVAQQIIRTKTLIINILKNQAHSLQCLMDNDKKQGLNPKDGCMDATFHIKKLDFKNFHHKLYGAKERIFGTFGKIKKVWALSDHLTPEFFINPIYIIHTPF